MNIAAYIVKTYESARLTEDTVSYANGKDQACLTREALQIIAGRSIKNLDLCAFAASKERGIQWKKSYGAIIVVTRIMQQLEQY